MKIKNYQIHLGPLPIILSIIVIINIVFPDFWLFPFININLLIDQIFENIKTNIEFVAIVFIILLFIIILFAQPIEEEKTTVNLEQGKNDALEWQMIRSMAKKEKTLFELFHLHGGRVIGDIYAKNTYQGKNYRGALKNCAIYNIDDQLIYFGDLHFTDDYLKLVLIASATGRPLILTYESLMDKPMKRYQKTQLVIFPEFDSAIIESYLRMFELRLGVHMLFRAYDFSEFRMFTEKKRKCQHEI